jgi:DNA-binding GntR family transcriptional regulator
MNLRQPTGQPHSEYAYAAIKELILSGKYAPEHPLVEESLARLFSISRTPVREALAILEHEKLISPRGQRGMFVRPVLKNEFIEHVDANEILLPILARRAAHLTGDEVVQVMFEVVEHIQGYTDKRDGSAALKEGREFYRLMGLAAENAPLAGFVLRNREHIDLFLLNSCHEQLGEILAALSNEYRDLLDDIIRRDPDEAANRAIFHLRSLRHILVDIFTEPEE